MPDPVTTSAGRIFRVRGNEALDDGPPVALRSAISSGGTIPTSERMRPAVLDMGHDDSGPVPRVEPPVTARTRAAAPELHQDWRRAYVRRIVVGDVSSAAVAGYVSQIGMPSPEPLAAIWTALAMPAAWVVLMLLARTYEERILWIGAEEFRRVFVAAMMLLATLGTVSWAFQLDVTRGFVVLAVPLALLGTLAQRLTHRRLLRRARQRGEHLQTTLLVGHSQAVESLEAQLDRDVLHGYSVVGCCLPTDAFPSSADSPRGLPILGSFDDVVDVVSRYGIDTVAVLPCPELDGPTLRRLGWGLEMTGAELLLVPAVTEIDGMRVRIRTVSGLSLMHVERPELTGPRRMGKHVFDKLFATLGLFLVLPVLLGIALAVKLTSAGPVFFRQQRVGRDGQTFSMLKFRSMVSGADLMIHALAAENDGNGVLFKKRDDPRITRVGRFIRRYSLDELPQLFNVIRGDMSLVGPRPPLPSEVERYGFDMHRRFLVKPGLTGLWQVNGRSDLSWDDSVRIDVRYVDNWSFMSDCVILWKTVAAVLRGTGAY